MTGSAEKDAPITRLSVNVNEDCAAHLSAMKDAGVSLTETVRRALALHKFVHDGGLAEVWDQGYTSGHSNAMRRMSDEPNAPTTPNPYRVFPPEGGDT